MTDSTQWLSQAAFAEQQGWTKQYVSKLVKSGRITLINGKINSQQALEELHASAEPSTALRRSSLTVTNHQQGVDFVTARTMREAFRAKLAKLDYEERAGQLTNAAAVRDDAFRAGRIVRDALLGIPDRLSDILAAENDPQIIRQLLLDELEQILNDLSRL